jgi:hypothetical protein
MNLDIIKDDDNYGKYIGISMRLSDLTFDYSLIKENFKIININDKMHNKIKDFTKAFKESITSMAYNETDIAKYFSNKSIVLLPGQKEFNLY